MPEGVLGRASSAQKEGRWGRVPPERRRIMQANRRRDTELELTVRSALFARGLRYRVDFAIRVPGHRAIRADVVFPRRRVAVFIDGCFWHGCPEHGTTPATNQGYWTPKIEENRERDRQHSLALNEAGWTVIRVWEHEDPAVAADTVAKAVAAASHPRCSSATK